jgi:nucleoside 2-deoxyribosyltransferase
MKVYYAHPITMYDTWDEQHEVKMLELMGFEVLNPNCDELDKAYNANKDFEVFLKAIESCDAVFYSAMEDGMISSGVVKEIVFAFELGMPVFEIPRNCQARYLTKEQTRERLVEAGLR